MIQWHRFVWQIYIYISLFYCVGSRSGKRGAFEAILKEVHDCPEPNPPYAKKRPIVSSYSISVSNCKRYFHGNSTVIMNTPFVNFTGRTYHVDSVGKRSLKFQILRVTCSNIFVRAILSFANVTVETRNCMLKKGIYRYSNLDLDKISHTMVGWHARGNIVHELQLVVAGDTVFCAEFIVVVQ